LSQGRSGPLVASSSSKPNTKSEGTPGPKRLWAGESPASPEGETDGQDSPTTSCGQKGLRKTHITPSLLLANPPALFPNTLALFPLIPSVFLSFCMLPAELTINLCAEQKAALG